MDYIFRIPLKPAARAAHGDETVDLHLVEYAYKPYWMGDADAINRRLAARHLGPTRRAWARAGKSARGVLYVYELVGDRHEDGEVYPNYVYRHRLNTPAFADESGETAPVGRLRRGKNGGWVIDPVVF